MMERHWIGAVGTFEFDLGNIAKEASAHVIKAFMLG